MTFLPMRSRLLAMACGLCAVLALPMEHAVAQDRQASAGRPGARPRIGLVLAGGGAKGGAHVGVLKVLEENQVPIDCIAGTSMGALIGAGYAAGMPAADLEKFLTGIDWKAIVGGAGRREGEQIEQKRLETEASTSMRLGFKDGKVVTPSGLADTSAIDDLLRTYVAKSRRVVDFNKLPIPYRAVATDMVTGKMVVLDHGDLATAMRASMAIPGAFSPVIMGRYILADGGQVRNIPVDVARETCADVVIVVNLVEPETPPEKLVQVAQLLSRSMDVMLQANENIQLATLTDRDVRIDVQMGDIGTSDFTRVPETIPLGEAAARKVADRLAAYSVSEAEYKTWRAHVTTRQDVEVRVAAVRFDGLEKVNPEYLRSLTKIQPGDSIDTRAVSDDAMRMSALADIDSVAYRVEGDAANLTLVWMPKESSVGHDVLSPSLGMYASGGGDMKFLIGAQYVRHWMNDRGGQWRNDLQVGYESLLRTGWYQPFDVAQRYFVEPELFATRSVEDLYVDHERIAIYQFVDMGGGIDLGANLGRAGQVRVGYLNTKRRVKLNTGIANLPDVDQRVDDTSVRDAGIVASAMYDSRDETTFARHGLAAEVQYVRSDTSLGADRDWDRIEAGLRSAIPFGKQAVWLGVAGGTRLGSDRIPGDRTFSLGGPRTLAAYELDAFRARAYWQANGSIVWPLMDLVAVKNQAIYGGILVQAVGLYDRIDRVPDGEVYSVAGFVGGPTPIGTLTFGIGGSSESLGFWLSLGRPIGRGSILDSGLFR